MRSLVVVLVALLAGCDTAPESPEERIRALFDEVERASREKDLGALRAMISEGYSDSAGRDKQAIEAILIAQYLRRGSIYVLVRVRDLELEESSRARVDLVAGLARTPVLDLADLRRPQADIYVFDVALAEEDDAEWRVVRAAWRPARPDDLM